MLGLQFETETSWADIAKVNLEQILTDHAFLEQKAASNAVSIIINYSEETELVKEMSNIAIEEMQHFKMVHLLMVALIEARSCERFKVFSENMEDEELSTFYKNLMISEANHYTTFLQFARQYQDRAIVDEKWNALLAFEAKMMRERGSEAKIHG
jgi:tRNA-(ms[2]io[6]A)-hydroxylase